MKNIKLIVGTVLLTICASKSVSSENLQGNLGIFDNEVNWNDINWRYGSRYDEDIKQAEIILMIDPSKAEIEAKAKRADAKILTAEDVGIFSKAKIEGGLIYYAEEMPKHGDAQSVVIGGMIKNGIMDINELTPNKDILRRMYFDRVQTLEIVIIKPLNHTAGLGICRDGTQVLISSEDDEQIHMINKLW